MKSHIKPLQMKYFTITNDLQRPGGGERVKEHLNDP